MQGQFISLDGIDGSGKTTHLNTIRNWFEKKGIAVLFTREPGGTPLGEKLRAMLLDKDTQVSIETEALLMFAARQQHIQDVIQPALANGICVVSDRFTDASFAYQGGGRGLPLQKIAQLENWVQGDFHPQLTILLDVPLAVSIERIERSRDKDRFEEEKVAFFERVQQTYHDLAAQNPARYRLINSHQDLELVKAQIEAVLDAWWVQYQESLA